MSIDRDLQRFKNIVRGQVKRNLKDYITQQDMIGKVDGDLVKIPIHRIDIPHFKFGSGDEQVGMGEGPGEGPGQGPEAGDNEGQHQMVDFSVEELVNMMGEELGLPAIEPKGKDTVMIDGYKYSSRANQGPEGLKHFKSTYKKSLKRLIANGEYDPKNPIVIPIKEDKIYKSSKPITKPHAQAVILYLMDVSGSMGDEEKDIVKTETFWMNAWLRKHYPKLETRFIIHDAKAKEVSEQEFFTTTESGGTVISTSYELAKQIIQKDYPVNEWNIYVFHFSDGDNWSAEDTNKCLRLLNDDLLKVINLFGYGQVHSRHGSGGFISDLKRGLKNNPKAILSSIENKSAILKSIKEFLGTGK